jgi:hypothetical protein
MGKFHSSCGAGEQGHKRAATCRTSHQGQCCPSPDQGSPILSALSHLADLMTRGRVLSSAAAHSSPGLSDLSESFQLNKQFPLAWNR